MQMELFSYCTANGEEKNNNLEKSKKRKKNLSFFSVRIGFVEYSSIILLCHSIRLLKGDNNNSKKLKFQMKVLLYNCTTTK